MTVNPVSLADYAVSPRARRATSQKWISKEEAAIRLGSSDRPLSTRRVLELATEGRLESGKVRNPKTGQMVVRINAGSVERFIFDRDNSPAPAPRPRVDNVRMPLDQAFQLDGASHTPQSPHPPHEDRTPLTLQDVQRTLSKLFGAIPAESAASSATPAFPARLWLTLKEATDYSGLPSDVIENSIGKGDIKAMFIGKGRRGGMWRIRKVDLEAFSG